MIQRKTTSRATAVATGDRTERGKGRKRRKGGSSGTTIEVRKASILAVIGLFGLLWIRFLWIVAGRNDSGRDHESFRLEFDSDEAPSCKPIGSPDSIDTTLVLQLSDDRLWMMRHHCERYGSHPMSIAVYTNSSYRAIRSELSGLGCDVSVDPIALSILDASTHGAWNDYPVNRLRNLALRNVETTHATIVDVDFWPSKNMHDTLMHPLVRRRLYDDPKLALVIPAYQRIREMDCTDETVECRDEHVQGMPYDIFQLQYQMKYNKTVEIFDKTNRGGHGSTDYHHWYQYQLIPHKIEERLVDIPCVKSHRYEPFLTIRYCREIFPPFQEAFSGYGKNKMSWIMQVIASGFVLAQTGGAFLVHYPHAISASRRDWNRAPPELVTRGGPGHGKNYNVRRPKRSDGDLGFDRYPRGRVDDLFVGFRSWLSEAIPSDRARLPMCGDDPPDDDARLWIDPSRKRNTTNNNNNKPRQHKRMEDALRDQIFNK